MSKIKHPINQIIIIFLLLSLASLWRFYPLMTESFHSDDLDYYLRFLNGECGTRASEILNTACMDKFRPIAAAIVLLFFNLVGPDIIYYYVLNIFLLGASATIFFLIAFNLSRSFITSFLLALLVATSRFSAYQVTQVIGPVEGLALLLFLGIIYCVIQGSHKDSSPNYYSWLSLFLCFLLIHNHERYIVVAFWMVIAFIYLPAYRNLSIVNLSSIILGCFLIPVLYVAYKTLALNSSFLMGTGGAPLDLNLDTKIIHLKQALLTLSGFNSGEQYLVAAPASEFEIFPFWLLSWFIAISYLLLAFVGIRNNIKPNQSLMDLLQRLRWPILFFILAIFLIAPAISTIRLEQRWIYSPYILILLIFAWSVGECTKNTCKKLTSIIAICFCIASIIQDSMIVRYYDRMFFIHYGIYAENVKKQIIDKYLNQSNTPLLLITNTPKCNGTIVRDGFFRIYGGRQGSFSCVTDQEVTDELLENRNIKLFYEIKKGVISEISGEWYRLNVMGNHPTVDMRKDNFEAGEATGIGEKEPWGRWTVGPLFIFNFNKSFPENFRLTISVTDAYGPNIGKTFVASIGDQKFQFNGPSSPKVFTFDFKNIKPGSNTFSIEVPSPSVGPLGDNRLLGLGISTIDIIPLK